MIRIPKKKRNKTENIRCVGRIDASHHFIIKSRVVLESMNTRKDNISVPFPAEL
jgi:hypothetical protein